MSDERTQNPADNPSSADDGSVEESFVLLELDELENSSFMEGVHTYSLIGLESSTPILKLDDNVFIGKIEDVVGTNLFFSDDPDQGCKYQCSSLKKIKFRRILLEAKDIGASKNSSADS
mmetsp:Transcript_16187/g.26682  ORF Transcript_16187/g.26682 Transcript_16187/m.26682 type:complete len:119 (-) Transcript_16187:612-968(-)|eukprot:CAMPEP_0184645736 /NCGR_PEP_ID=MMETSP0308-20130426/2311_1 /TAXON_ID=38269 /ORGANISM="Gloeochaete witrockiana, Strain SAG 46.84" /LENGTH=118 /DNA_ID=CAMNT_0027075079 /DNA_START=149 /DNA_END=505 /DNA_ORIENTATION=+